MVDNNKYTTSWIDKEEDEEERSQHERKEEQERKKRKSLKSTSRKSDKRDKTTTNERIITGKEKHSRKISETSGIKTYQIDEFRRIEIPSDGFCVVNACTIKDRSGRKNS